MIKSRVSLAQVTSLGRSSAYAMYYVFLRVRVRIAWTYICVCVYVFCCAIATSSSSVLFVRVADI